MTKSLPLSPSRYEFDEFFSRYLRRELKANCNVLDAGHGKFYLISILKTFKCRINYFGVDVEKVNLPKVPKNLKLTISQSDITRYTTNKKFDLVMCLWVLEHIQKDKMALRKFQNLMKSHGNTIIAVPSVWSWPIEFGKHGYHYYTKKRLNHLVKESGYSIESFHSMGGILGLIFMICYSWPRYILLLLSLPVFYYLKLTQNNISWERFSKDLITKTLYSYHNHKLGIILHNSIVRKIVAIDKIFKIFPASYVLILKK